MQVHFEIHIIFSKLRTYFNTGQNPQEHEEQLDLRIDLCMQLTTIMLQILTSDISLDILLSKTAFTTNTASDNFLMAISFCGKKMQPQWVSLNKKQINKYYDHHNILK